MKYILIVLALLMMAGLGQVEIQVPAAGLAGPTIDRTQVNDSSTNETEIIILSGPTRSLNNSSTISVQFANTSSEDLAININRQRR